MKHAGPSLLLMVLISALGCSAGRAGTRSVPFAGEIFMDSTEAQPHVERLMHHRSRTAWVSSNCQMQSSYWTQPHAMSDREGRRIAFGSSWGDVCRADAYVIDVMP